MDQMVILIDFQLSDKELKQTIFRSYFNFLSCNPSSNIANSNFFDIASCNDFFYLLLKKTLLFFSNNFFSSK